MKALIVVYAVGYGVQILLEGTGIAGMRGPLGVFEPLALLPASVVQRGHVWQLFSHVIVQDPSSALGLFLNLASFWLMGSPIERTWGARSTLSLMAVASVLGAIVAVLAGFVDARLFRSFAIGPAAATTALLAAWCVERARLKLSLFGAVTMTGQQLLLAILGLTAFQFAWNRSGTGITALVGFAVGAAVVRWRARQEPTATTRRASRESGPQFRVIRGGGRDDLPN
jgi:membrane associated rhomboid family serine protease